MNYVSSELYHKKAKKATLLEEMFRVFGNVWGGDLTTVGVTASRVAKVFARVLRRLPLLIPRFISHCERSGTHCCGAQNLLLAGASPNFDRCHSLFLALSAPGGARKRPSRRLPCNRRSRNLSFSANAKKHTFGCADHGNAVHGIRRRRNGINAKR